MSNSQESQRAEEECNFPAKALSTFRGSQRPLSAAGNCLLSSITAHTHMEGHFPQDSELQLYVGLFITRGSGPVYARTFKVVISIKTSIMLTFEQSYVHNLLSSLFWVISGAPLPPLRGKCEWVFFLKKIIFGKCPTLKCL